MTNKKIILFLLVILFSCRNNSINNTENQHIDTLDTYNKEIISEEESEITQLSPNPIKRTFVLTVVGERPYKKQPLFLTDSLVINEERYIQILDNKVFRDLIDMDYYTYRIKELPIQNDSILSFTLDKEGSDPEENSSIKWFDFSSENRVLLEEVAACDEKLIEKFIGEEEISKSDVDTFISTSAKLFEVDGEKRKFSGRIFVSTTNKWSKKANNLIENQEINVQRISRDQLENSDVDWSKKFFSNSWNNSNFFI